MLKVGLIGCGNISVIHLEAINKNADALLVSVCDIKNDVVSKVANEMNCKAYSDYAEMLEHEDLDVVHICTPHYLHKEMIVKALSLNIHVVTEKPVVMNIEESKAVQAALSESTAKLAVTFQNRLNPTSLVMRRYVDEGTLGELIGIKGFVTWCREPIQYYAESDWRGQYATEGGGFLINQGIHTLDLIQWLGGEINTLNGSYSTKAFQQYIEVEDTAEIYIEFKNGAKGLFYGTNAYSTNTPVEMELMFQNGLLKYMNGKLYIEDENKDFVFLEEDFAPDQRGMSYWGASHQKTINAFYKAIIDNTSDYINLDEGLKTIAILDQLRNKDK